MRNLSVVILVISCCLLGACATLPPEAIVYQPVDCVIEAENDAIFEVLLDGDLILSGKAVAGTPQNIQFSVSTGHHDIVVTAESHEMWEREITIQEVPAERQHFWVKLEKRRIRIPTTAR